MGDRRQRRPLYAPPPQRRQHSVLGFWVPLVVTSTIALGGLAAWIWSERSDEDDYSPDKPPRPRPGEGGAAYPPPQHGGGGSVGQGGAPPGYAGPIPNQSAGPQGAPAPAPAAPGGGEASSYYASRDAQHHEEQEQDQTFFGQIRGSLRRTPSPQQFLDHASKQVTAGIAAAGSALGSIMEDNEHSEHSDHYGGDRRERREDREREGFSDHERWSEEADEKIKVRERSVGGPVEAESERRADAALRSVKESGKGRSRRSVAIVVSADTNMDGKMDDQDIVYDQHASILSHLPEHHDPSRTDLFVLIYAPGLTSLPPTTYRPSTMDVETASNLGSSYSAVNTPLGAGTPAMTPGEELQSISPRIDPVTDFQSPGRQFDALYTQASSLVDSPTKILCFTSPASYLPILRHLSPQLAYVSELLAGHEGETVGQLKGWVGQSVVVIGDDGTGGLADTETEDEGEDGKRIRHEAWYEHSSLVGLGKGMEVVDAARVGDDWVKRVGGRE